VQRLNRYYRRSRISEPRFRLLLQHFALDLSAAQAAQLTGTTFVDKVLGLHRAGTDLAPRPHGGGYPARLLPRHEKLLRAEVGRRKDSTLEELRSHLEAEAGLVVSAATVSRALTRLDLPRKKSLAASERNNYKRGWYRRRARSVNHRRLIFVDETVVNTAMTRRHGRAPKGERVCDSAPRNYGSQTSAIGAMGMRGLAATLTVEGAVDTLCFDAYAEQVLGPRLHKGDAVVLDNLGAHRATQDRGGARGTRGSGLVAFALL
jgi:transposase